MRIKKRYIAALLAVVALALGARYLLGCGQGNPEVITKAAQPEGLSIQGTTYHMIPFYDTPSASWQLKRGSPLAGVTLYLSGQSGTSVASSNNNGEYLFTNLQQNPAGSNGYTIVASKEGYQRLMISGVTFTGQIPLPDNSIITQDIEMNPRPVVLAITPFPGATIEAAILTVTVEFSKAMDTSTVMPSFSPVAFRTFGAGNAANVTSTWSNQNKTLTVKTGQLLANMFYRLVVDSYSSIKDASGNPLDPLMVYGPNDTGSEGLPSDVYNGSSLNWSYRTRSGGVPGAPGNFSLSVSGEPSASFNFQEVMLAGFQGVRFHWDRPAGNISGYKLYASASLSGAWNLMTLLNASENYYVCSPQGVNNAIFGSTMVDPVGTGRYAMVNGRAYFKVVAYNGDGEGAGATLEAQDSIPPQVDPTAWSSNSSFTGLTLQNNYYLEALTNKSKAYVFFNEPIDPSTAIAANFEITTTSGTPRTVSGVSFLTSHSGFLGQAGAPAPLESAYAVVEVTASGDITGSLYRIKAKEGKVRDLAGNKVAAGGSTTGTLP
ncbi:MAG: Ig-like domain-containing protein [Candidatus Margulisbacteria bacterium]|nr:Ig-like domain-containing protein [Candidatus Margulisiibacteriota bacterium]